MSQIYGAGDRTRTCTPKVEEPKGDVTLVNVLRCVKNTFLNNSNGYYRNAQVSSFVGDTIFLRISDKGSSLLIYFFTTILNSSF